MFLLLKKAKQNGAHQNRIQMYTDPLQPMKLNQTTKLK